MSLGLDFLMVKRESGHNLRASPKMKDDAEKALSAERAPNTLWLLLCSPQARTTSQALC